VKDTAYSTSDVYDLVTIASGDREDPLDKLTSANSLSPVKNRIYAFRDVNYVTGKPATTPAALTDASLSDVTSNTLQDPDDPGYAAALNDLKTKKGWRLDLIDGATATWIGEKGLARTTIFDSILYVTTYIPSQAVVAEENSCSSIGEGIARQYALHYLNATAVVDFDNDGTSDRYNNIGGGIPSETVVIVQEGGVSSLVGTSGGAANPKIDSSLPRYRTYWYEGQ
jgi:type IV pilus assembly protein PilY1